MCVICVKKSGVPYPSLATMQTCFSHNPDGAGFMYYSKKDNTVKIYKGYMTWESFKKTYEKLQRFSVEIPFIFHFRIGTHGLVKDPRYCHPFPVSSDPADLTSKKIEADYGVAHNGIISTIDFGTKLSDTMEFIQYILNPLMCNNPDIDDMPNSDILEGILETSNKLAILDSEGKIQLYGDFNTDVDGNMYSNWSYKAYTYLTSPLAADNDSYNPKCTKKSKCCNYGYFCDDCKNDDMYYDYIDYPDDIGYKGIIK